MDGVIGVRSDAGTGSTFWIDLPRASSPMVQLEEAGLGATIGDAGRNHIASKRTILYVEDNLSNLTLVQRIVSLRAEIELIPAMQGGLALELARSHRPDLILLDLHLPDIQGDEVLRQLRSDPEFRDTPVVILSADATKGQPDKLMALGALAYLTKPLDVKHFIELIDSLLDGRKAA
jgi:CheY-like chemotaxis protein